MIIGDGMADYPIPELKWKTPLEVAEHPNMDEIAAKGLCGMIRTIPKSLGAGSENRHFIVGSIYFFIRPHGHGFVSVNRMQLHYCC
jgi:2,3-bisphosphoglycerate-independent phosphoglycerate mutase